MNMNTCEKYTYKRHEPEKTLLYQTMAEHLESWLAKRQADSSRTPLPEFVTKELRGFLRCGVLQYGFVMANCETCDSKNFAAFSCKKRGFCSSCLAKRMSESSAHLIDNVLPRVPYRQWVVTFPHSLRFWMAASRSLTNLVHKIVSKMIICYYEYQAKNLGMEGTIPAGITFIQRFGGGLNLNLHFHIITADGVFSTSTGQPVFHHLRGPNNEEVAQVLEAIAHGVISLLKEKNYLCEDGTLVDRPDCIDKEFIDSEQLTAAVAASNMMMVAFGENAGKKVRRIGRGFGYEEEAAFLKSKRCSSINGFTVHANRYIGQQERGKLEQILSYAARPGFSHERLSLKDPNCPDGDFIYKLKTPWSDGTEAIVLSIDELFEKLSALIPPPYVHLTRYFGILASHNKWRKMIILRPNVKKGWISSEDGQSVERMNRSKLLKRVFAIDIDICQNCGGKIRLDACILVIMPFEIEKILKFIGLKCHPPPIKQARFIEHEMDFDHMPDYETPIDYC